MDEVKELCVVCCFGLCELGGTSKEVVDSVKLALVNKSFIHENTRPLPVYAFSYKHTM
jgi:hypothetical protein